MLMDARYLARTVLSPGLVEHKSGAKVKVAVEGKEMILGVLVFTLRSTKWTLCVQGAQTCHLV